jgi:peptide/nickel transport system ATP-binding protein
VLRRGEALAIVGESGSGKSSLGRVLLRLVRHARGEVRLHHDGRDVDLLALAPRELRRLRRALGIVFQDPYASLDPRMRVLDLVTEPLRIHGTTDAATLRARASALMTQVGLEPAMLDRHPHAFSGGQRQRIAIARALAGDPALLLCDEAVSALDAHQRRAILQLLSTLKRERGLALLFITHDLAGASLLADRIAVMDAGRIVETGAIGDVLASPRHPHTRALLGIADAQLAGGVGG